MRLEQSAVLLWLLLWSSAAAAETPRSASLESYRQARAVLDAGIEAMGGARALQDLATVRRDMGGGWLDVGQAPRPWSATADTTMPPAHQQEQMFSFIDYAGDRWFESLRYSQVSSPAEYAVQVDVVTPKEGFRSVAYMEQKPFLQRFAASDLTDLRLAKSRSFPEGLLRTALDRPETLRSLGTVQEEGRDQAVISLSDAAGVRVLLYFDAETHLLVKSETLRDHPVAGDASRETLYLDYRRAGRLRLPHRIVHRVAGLPTEDLRVDSIELNEATSEERFRRPEIFVEIQADPAAPEL